MEESAFQTPDGTTVSAVTADEMQNIDRIAVEEIGLALLQMMENAGRNLAAHSQLLREEEEPVTIVAGGGGNGGGGLAAARHVANRDIPVTVVLDRKPAELEGATATQHRILRHTDVSITTEADSIDAAGLIVDALIGYGLREAPRGRAAELIAACDTTSASILSLDVPSGVDATTGDEPGEVIRPDRTLTLALPKTGLSGRAENLYLADIGIPTPVYRRLDIPYTTPFTEEYWVKLESI